MPEKKQGFGDTSGLELRSPAKINLFLCVTARRSDGYHELFTLICPISLYDVLRMDFDCSKIAVRCGHPDVPENETNLAYRAARVFFDALVQKRGLNSSPGVLIEIEKRIPVGGGLGGGSGNAAAVLTSLNHHFESPFTLKELMRMGLGLGADVPFFLLGRPALARGIGEDLEIYTKIPSYHVVLICPNFTVSTAMVYKNLNLALTKCEKKPKYRLFKKQGFQIGSHLCNDLESVTLQWHPEIMEAKRMLMAHGARGALMSGSGCSVFGLFESGQAAQRAGREIAGVSDWRIFVANLLM